MKRRQLLRHLSKHGCLLLREGGRHSVYWNPQTFQTTAIPRHTEILEPVAVKICKDLGIPRPG